MSEGKPDIVVFGSSNMDMITYTENMPKVGETIRGKDFKLGFGGKGANQCVAAGRLGGKVVMVSRVGDDNFGRDTVENYKKNGVDTALVKVTEGQPTGVAQITVDAEAHNEIIIVPGANDAMTPAEDAEGNAKFVETVKEAKIVVCQLEVSLAATVSALRVARDNKVVTLLNPAPAVLPTDTLEQCELVRQLYALSDVFVPNETELETLTGLSVKSISDAERAAERVLRGTALGALGAAPRYVLVTLGENGSLLARKNPTTGAIENCFQPLTQRVKAIDTTGAGDCFIGALVFFLVREMKPGMTSESDEFFEALKHSIPKACTVASNSVTKRGTQISYPHVEDLPAELFQ